MGNATVQSNYTCLSLWPLSMPWSHLLTWVFFSIVLSPITILSNAMLLYALHNTQQLVTITNKFIFLMCISDLCTGVIVLPMKVAMILTNNSLKSCTFELATQYIAFLCAYFSFFMLLCIAMDRYIHVTKLNRYDAFINDFRMKVVAILSFGLSALIAYITISFPSFPLQVVLNLSDLFGVSLMFVLYARVFQKVKLHAKNFKRMLEEIGTVNAEKLTKRELAATKTIRLVLGALLLLYLPYNICSAIWTYSRFHLRQEPGLVLDAMEYWSYLIVFSNAAVNAIILSYGNSKTRNFIKDKLRNTETFFVSSVEECKQDTESQLESSKTNNCFDDSKV